MRGCSTTNFIETCRHLRRSCRRDIPCLQIIFFVCLAMLHFSFQIKIQNVPHFDTGTQTVRMYVGIRHVFSIIYNLEFKIYCNFCISFIHIFMILEIRAWQSIDTFCRIYSLENWLCVKPTYRLCNANIGHTSVSGIFAVPWTRITN